MPSRRFVLTSALSALALSGLASCTQEPKRPGGQDGPTVTPEPTTADNPFGLARDSEMRVMLFRGGHGTDYANTAARIIQDKHGITVDLQTVDHVEREVGELEDAPDLLDNSGAGRIQLAPIIDKLEDLTDVVDSANLEGVPIRETLYTGALEPSTYDDQLVGVNYALTVYGLWYSASWFESNGWRPPETWDDLLDLGKQAKAMGKYLFLWGAEAADYYLEMCITSAIKEGGHEVRKALDSLADGCWGLPTVQATFNYLHRCVEEGMVRPGGSGTEYLAAQALWSNNQEALLYPAGSWMENEMRDQTADDFRMTVAPVPTLTSSPSLPYAALHSNASETFIIPKAARNVPGGKEFLRTMLSKEAATEFTREVLVPSVVKGTVPADAYGSTSLASQVRLLGDAADHIVTWKFDNYYGLAKGFTKAFNAFLEGQMDVPTLTGTLQEATDAVRNDRSIPKYEVD